MSALLRPLAAALLCALCTTASADILVGNQGDGTSAQPMFGFADDATGDATPIRRIDGPASPLFHASQGVYEPVEDVVYIADFRGQAIHVYGVGANGDALPRRTLTPGWGQIRGVVVDRNHDEMIAIVSNCCLAAFPRTASGTTGPLRFVQPGTSSGSVTQLNNPARLAYIQASDEIAVTDYAIVNQVAVPKILFFPRTATNNTPPSRSITGSATQIGDFAAGVAYDAATQQLFVLAYVNQPGGTKHGRVLVFDAAANGNVAPLRVIEGPLTGLDLPSGAYFNGIAFDPMQQRLIVSAVANPNAAVLVFAAGANGGAPPMQTIVGTSSGLNSPGVAIPVPDRILRTGFDS